MLGQQLVPVPGLRHGPAPHVWFGLSLWGTRKYLARKSLLRPSHGALSATESALLRAQRYNKVCTPDACAANDINGMSF